MENEAVTMPLLGDPLPKMQVQTTHGAMTLPDDYKGRWFVLFSHPADFTPVCTTEFYSFQQNYEKFKELDCALIGMSIDQVFSHIKWVEWINENLGTHIEFPIIAGTEQIACRLGMLHPGKGANTVRAVFVCDKEGHVRTVLYYPQEIGRNISEIIRTVRALQISENQCALPANWPENELIQDKVIVPPPGDEESAEKRKQQYDNYDWWFAYREQ